jgi:hypothetical protein
MTQYAFGQTIPVLGPNIGFAGAISRFSDRVVAARQFVPTASTSNNLNFGDPAVLIPNNSGGYFNSVADFVAAATANIANVANYFAGMAVREVKTQLTYGAGTTPGVQQVGYYSYNQIAEVLERGAGVVALSVGSSSVQAGSQVYTRVVLNSAVTAGTVGDWETNPAASDLFTLTGVTGVAAGQTALTLTATGVYVGQVVSGPGVAPGTYVVSGTGTAGSYSAIVLSQAITTALTNTSPLTFSNLVALPNVVVRTGFVDANGMLEITVKVRDAA